MDGRLARLRRLGRWWQAASEAERFRLYAAAVAGYSEAPPLEELRLAAFVAELEAGEVAEG